MAKIKLKVIGLPQSAEVTKEDTMNVENIWGIIQRIESKYPSDYYTLNIFLNGISVNDKLKNLHDGDEVVIVPIMSGG